MRPIFVSFFCGDGDGHENALEVGKLERMLEWAEEDVSNCNWIDHSSGSSGFLDFWFSRIISS